MLLSQSTQGANVVGLHFLLTLYNWTILSLIEVYFGVCNFYSHLVVKFDFAFKRIYAL